GLPRLRPPSCPQKLDSPGAKNLAAIAKKPLPPQFQEEQQGQQPQQQLAQMQQQMQQAQQVIDLLTKELEKKTQIIEADTVKADAQVQITQLEIASKERIEALRAQVDLLKAEIAANDAQARAGLGATAGTERVLWQGVARHVAQLDQQAHEKELAAQAQQAQRDLAQAAQAAPPQGAQGGPAGGPGPEGV